MGETTTFRECESCAAKPGAPDLCRACLHNRSTVARLLAALRTAVSGWEASESGWYGGDRQMIEKMRKEFEL